MTVPAAENLRPVARHLSHAPHLAADAERVRAAADLLEAIDALHPAPDVRMVGHWCVQCNQEWPCPTARLLHPEHTQGDPT